MQYQHTQHIQHTARSIQHSPHHIQHTQHTQHTQRVVPPPSSLLFYRTSDHNGGLGSGARLVIELHAVLRSHELGERDTARRTSEELVFAALVGVHVPSLEAEVEG